MPEYVFDVESKGEISDGSHTFNELYYHRMILFSVICNINKEKSWKSWKHDDGTMFDDYFIVGIDTTEGSYTYHYHKDYWDLFNVEALMVAPKWDGHKPEDITRLLTIKLASLDGEFTVEDQLHAEVRRLQLENFQLERRILNMKRNENKRSREFSKLNRKLRKQDEKLNYMNHPVSYTKGKGKKKKRKGQMK